uniref:ubiquitinyl hydrolase 1 n=1 Tax=Albugo laibachii Nc14 TaxID=890382 RepID=F0WLJ8_9STRA|nr:ubiquitinspecific protease putative [Albugo laibachii Nc14]|eukprot:CCA22162.1 ubiquitinspecific protease putative [Albugo laibachii Nc14]
MTAYKPASILPVSHYNNAEAFVIENAVDFSERHLFPHIRKGIRSSASTEITPSRKGGLVGLENIGNTCCVQCLSHLQVLMRYFDTNDRMEESAGRGQVVVSFHSLMQKLWSNAKSIEPYELKRVISRLQPQFQGHEQHDAQEFLRFLLDSLHDELNRVQDPPKYREIKTNTNANDREVSDGYWGYHLERNQSFFSDTFCGQLGSEVKCQSCLHRSLCFDTFWDISLSFPLMRKIKHPILSPLRAVFQSRVNVPNLSMESRNGSKSIPSSPKAFGFTRTVSPTRNSLEERSISLIECLELFTASELLEESNGFYCSKCRKNGSTWKTIVFYRLPEILVIHLKRFEVKAAHCKKNMRNIEFPVESLDLERFCASGAVLDGGTKYDLMGVVLHDGTLNDGHYTAECLHGVKKAWYSFNDACVSSIAKPSNNSASPYILFYQRRPEQSLTI